MRHLVFSAVVLILFAACGTPTQRQQAVKSGLPERPGFAPSLILLPEDKPRILERIEREPFASILAGIEETAARDHVDLPPDTFDSDEQRNGETALAAAFLAWLLDDATWAAKARDFMTQLSDNYWSHEDHDLNIRMPAVAMGYTFALDLLQGAEEISSDEAAALEAKLTTLMEGFFEEYLLTDIRRLMSIQYTQNNHPIRTALSLATVALAFPDHPDAPTWASWALSELDYLWGPTGHYVGQEGGVSEGSLYYRFAYAPSLAFSLAWRNRVGEPRRFPKSCLNRVDEFHWADHGCVEGEPFDFVNLIDQERFQLTTDWFFSLRMPDGHRPPIEDASPKRDNGAAIMAGILDRGDLLWDWENDERNMGGGWDLSIQHLAYLPEAGDLTTPVEPPAWRHRVMPAVGHAVLRSGWGPDDLWALLIAEHGDSRLTVHDHVDSGSIQLFAYGEYLLMDTGYFKPNMNDNAITSQAGAHSLLMIEGEAVEEKGLVTDYGDADAFLENEHLGESLAWVEARQPIEESTTERALALVRNRYLVVFDRVDTPVTTLRKHTWRLHGFAGLDMGGSFTLDATAQTARWEKTLAGVDVYLAAADRPSDTATALALVEPPFVEFERPYVHKFESEAAHHAVLDGVIHSRAPHFAAVVVPYRVGATSGDEDAPLTVTRLVLDDGGSGEQHGLAGWIVEHDGQRDLVLARAPDAPETITLADGVVIATDGCWVLVTLSGDAPLAVVARGSYLALDGQQLHTDVTAPVAVSAP